MSLNRSAPEDGDSHPRHRAGRSVAAEGRARAGMALLLIDVINPLSFPGAQELYRAALPAARRIRRLAMRAREAKAPVIYVNDNFGRWQSDFRGTVRFCRTKNERARSLVDLLAPQDDDYFVLKPMHSGFYLTPLEMLLHALGAHTVVLTGFATDMCVLQTAVDAHMRNFRLVLPRDCTAAETPARARFAIETLRRNYRAGISSSARVAFSRR